METDEGMGGQEMDEGSELGNDDDDNLAGKQAVTVASNESDNKNANTNEEANASADDLMEIQA
jgi:hypothetical protein